MRLVSYVVKYFPNSLVNFWQMNVWVKVGQSQLAIVVVDEGTPYIYHLKRAIKLEMPNAFQTTDKVQIIVRDPNTNIEILPEDLLTLTSINGLVRGSIAKPLKDKRAIPCVNTV